jgi:uncharacterized membrane protein YhaH (DUF805 family)
MNSSSFADQLVWLFFKLDGRISRATYLLAGLLLAVIQGFMLYRFTLVPEESGEGAIWALGFWAIGILSIWCGFALGVKRVHDFGKPGVLALALFVPVVLLIAFVVLCVWPGDPGPNAYGPRTNARRSG